VNLAPSNFKGFPSDLRTKRAGNCLTLYFEARASSDSRTRPNCNVFYNMINDLVFRVSKIDLPKNFDSMPYK